MVAFQGKPAQFVLLSCKILRWKCPKGKKKCNMWNNSFPELWKSIYIWIYFKWKCQFPFQCPFFNKKQMDKHYTNAALSP